MAVRELHIGEYPGEPVGGFYRTRIEAMERHVHTQSGRGIDARVDGPGAGAICPSGGYKDDVDHGDWMLYTGQGGRDMETGHQIADQSLDARDNAALVKSCKKDLPVRVLRGSSKEGYTYDGLYWVDDYWTERGRDGFIVCQFLVVQLTPEEALPWVHMADYPGQDLPTVASFPIADRDPRRPPIGRGYRIHRLLDPVRHDEPSSTGGTPEDIDLELDYDVDTDSEDPSSAPPGATGVDIEMPVGNEIPDTVQSTVYRKQRDSKVTKAVKALYDDRCQVCDTRVELSKGAYSEGAHVRPIGAPHNGPDKVTNMLCLCPNHHVMFDGGGLYITNNYFVYDCDGRPVGPLTVDVRNHLLSLAHLTYHRSLHGLGA